MRLLKITNHSVSSEQRHQLEAVWKISEILEPPVDLAQMFRKVPLDMLDLKKYASPFLEWIYGYNLKENEPIWVQGEQGLTFMLVQRLITDGLKPIYATTPRIVTEVGNEKKTIFKHHSFRKYQII